MSSKSSKPAEMYGITRGAWGWAVAFRRNGVNVCKAFSFQRLHGEANALIQAKAWSDEMLRKHPPVPRRTRAETVRSSNTSGIPGIASRLGPDGEPVAWIATTTTEGKYVSKFFSIKRYGADAKKLAIAERQKQLQQMVGLVPTHPAEAMLREGPAQLLPSDGPALLTARQVLLRTNKSGFPGVRHMHDHNPEHPGWWVARTRVTGGKSMTKQFSIQKHGDDEAKTLAINERQKQLELVAERSKLVSTQSAPQRAEPANRRRMSRS